jgi:hypothetical protein
MTRSQTRSVEQIRPEGLRIVIRLYRQVAMNAHWPVHDGVDAAATTPATMVALKTGAFEKNHSGLAALLEPDGAGDRQAGVTCRYASSIDEHSAHRFGRRYIAARLRKAKRPGSIPRFSSQVPVRRRGGARYIHTRTSDVWAPDGINNCGGRSMCRSGYTDREVLRRSERHEPRANDANA